MDKPIPKPYFLCPNKECQETEYERIYFPPDVMFLIGGEWRCHDCLDAHLDEESADGDRDKWDYISLEYELERMGIKYE